MENWTIKEDSLNYLPSSDYWTCDIMEDGERLPTMVVFGKTEKECLSRAKKICKVNEMEEALKWLITQHNEDYINIASTEMNPHFNDEVITDKLLEIQSLLKDLES